MNGFLTTTVTPPSSFAAGFNTKAKGDFSFAMGQRTSATGATATAFGNGSSAAGKVSFAAGNSTVARGMWSTAFGNYSQALGNSSFASGDFASSTGIGSTAMGSNTEASGKYSTALGIQTIASGDRSTSVGDNTTASGAYSTALGTQTVASGDRSTSMGDNTNASGDYSTAMGEYTVASGDYSTAIGKSTKAIGYNSLATGYNSTSSGAYSTAMGINANTNNHANSFCIAGASNDAAAVNTLDNQMMMRFDNYTFWISSSNYAYLVPASNGWAYTSDINKKENFQEMNGETVLKKISGIPFYSWNFKANDTKQYRHYGIMAQHFYNAFGKDDYGFIGNDTTVSPLDLLGVAYSGIKALEKRTEILQEQNDKMAEEIAALKMMKAEMEKLQKALDAINKK